MPEHQPLPGPSTGHFLHMCNANMPEHQPLPGPSTSHFLHMCNARHQRETSKPCPSTNRFLHRILYQKLRPFQHTARNDIAFSREIPRKTCNYFVQSATTGKDCDTTGTAKCSLLVARNLQTSWSRVDACVDAGGVEGLGMRTRATKQIIK